MIRDGAAARELEQRLGYAFADRALLDQALTHASLAGHGVTTPSNERLEFLGDRVLGLLAAQTVFERFPQEPEGALTHRLAGLVDRSACARVARGVGLEGALRRAGVNVHRPSAASDTVLADACEALLAAVYLDGGLEAARDLFIRLWAEELTAERPRLGNPKVQLQEWMQGRGRPAPTYAIVSRMGAAHEPIFTVELTADGFAPAQGLGRSRADAEKAAAQALIEREKLA